MTPAMDLEAPLLPTPDAEAPPVMHVRVLGNFLSARRAELGTMSRISSTNTMSRSSSTSSFKSNGSTGSASRGQRSSSGRARGGSVSILLESGLRAARPRTLRDAARRASMRSGWQRVSISGASRSALELKLVSYAAEVTLPNSPIEEAPTSGPSWQQVGITIANCLVGAGCLGLPFALRQAGWAGLLIILLATMATCSTAKMLVASIETLNRRKLACVTYDDLVEHTFGWWGNACMRVMTVLELYGGIVCMVVLHSVNWPALLSLPPTPLAGIVAATGIQALAPLAAVEARVLVTASVCSLALPTLLVQARHLSMFATVGLAATLMVATVTVAAPVLADLPLPDGATCPTLDASAAKSDGEDPIMGHAALRLEGLGVATGLALFAFAGHATFPEMWRQMSSHQRPKFSKACNLGFSLAAFFYSALAALGYYFFGDCAADSLTLNLLGVSPSLGGLATCGVLLSTFTSISVLSVPVVRICREAFACGDKAAIARLRQREMLSMGWLQHSDATTLAIKVVMMALAGLVALTVPNFGFIVALIGAFTCMLISLILPTLCNLAVHGRELSTCAILLNVAIVAMGFVGMVAGVRSILSG
jgi:vesicular inhibitory amino acid transporter